MPKRKGYTVAYKMRVVDWYTENGASAFRTAKEFNVNPSMVTRWVQNKEQLEIEVQGERTRKRQKLHPGRNANTQEIDKKLVDFLMEKRSQGLAVSDTSLIEKAGDFAAELGMPNFTASRGYLYRWKKRNHIVIRRKTNESQKVPADFADCIREFRAEIRQATDNLGIPKQHIFNMDQTMVHFDMPVRYTNDIAGSKQIRIKTTGNTKKGATVALCCSATGIKLPALLIFKEKGGVFGRHVAAGLQEAHNVRIQASKNGWMTQELYHWWLRNIFGAGDEIRMLVVDSYRAHMTQNSVNVVADECDACLIFIPAGCTSLVQPLDVVVNRAFKDEMRKQWGNWISENRPLTIAGNLKSATRQDVINFVSRAWDSISIETIRLGFLRCGIANNLDGSEDQELADYIPQP
jgi:transposase-like protein